MDVWGQFRFGFYLLTTYIHTYLCKLNFAPDDLWKATHPTEYLLIP